MDYKQEAERIMDLFFHEVLHYDVEFGHQLAKACAAICVNEIIEDINNPDTHLGFWDKVLNEINSK